MITRQLIEAIRSQYRLPWNGIHGIGHWARVRENGLCIAAKLTGVNIKVVELFAVFHDARRMNDGTDIGHGYRGGELAKRLRGLLFEVSDDEFELLFMACWHHTDGHTNGEITVQTCWDADRLDLGRVGKTPNPRFLCTSVAKDPDLIARANACARQRIIPQFAIDEWLDNPTDII
jgi:uncharacterized protein